MARNGIRQLPLLKISLYVTLAALIVIAMRLGDHKSRTWNRPSKMTEHPVSGFVRGTGVDRMLQYGG